MRIGIVNYGMGNILSVYNAIAYLGFKVDIINHHKQFQNYSKYILPGVGAFDNCINNLNKKGFSDILNNEVIVNKKPILGICLGMQVMALSSKEGGNSNGFGWFNATVELIKPRSKNLKIPHIGWNNIHLEKESPLFRGISDFATFYFVHSYHMKCNNNSDILATTNYESEITAIVQKGNIVGVQFHPEKSQESGLTILSNFCTWDF